jgi:hypothetical protein
MKTPCPSLHHFGLLLQAAYASVTDAQAGKGSVSLFSAERDLARVHRLITRHRDFCPQCRVNDEHGKSSKRETMRGAEVIPINRAG